MNVIENIFKNILRLKNVISIEEYQGTHDYRCKQVIINDIVIDKKYAIVKNKLLIPKQFFNEDNFINYGLIADYHDYVIYIPRDELFNVSITDLNYIDINAIEVKFCYIQDIDEEYYFPYNRNRRKLKNDPI